MKKTITTLALFAIALSASAQEISNHAIGLRLGDNKGFGTEINYQHYLGGNNRIEAGLGWLTGNKVSGFHTHGLYQWVWHLEDRFNWYAGVGGGLGTYSIKNSDNNNSNFFLFASGNVGVEYNFDIPILISLDLRPEIGLLNYRNDVGFALGLSIRYQFD